MIFTAGSKQNIKMERFIPSHLVSKLNTYSA
jgi:hypothetical protein